MNRFFFLITALFPLFLFSINVDKSVVKVETHLQMYTGEPWESSSIGRGMASGFVVASNQVVTNAHGVSHATHIRVKLPGSTKSYPAIIKVIGDDCDLALLQVDDPEFARYSEPVSFAEVQDGDEVTVIGFPLPYHTLSYTKGIVSSSYHKVYQHSGAYLSAIQIDAAVNMGNSGGPVVHHGKVVGVAFGKIGGLAVDNICFMIPTSLVKHFLREASQGKYQGFPRLGMTFQPLIHPDLRRYLDLNDETTGVMIVDAADYEELQEGDILTRIDDIPLNNDGSIYVDGARKDLFFYVFLQKHLGDTVKLQILRNQIRKDLHISIHQAFNHTPSHARLSYYIYAGLVFDSFQDANDAKDTLYLRKVLAHPVNVGYQDLQNCEVVKIGSKQE